MLRLKLEKVKKDNAITTDDSHGLNIGDEIYLISEGEQEKAANIFGFYYETNIVQ